MKLKATANQVLAAFEALSREDRRKILSGAAKLVRGTRFTDATDLMHEAVARALNGGRVWPLDVPFPAFLTNAMRSIAHGDRIRLAATAEDSGFDAQDFEDHDCNRSRQSAFSPSAEHEAMANQERYEAGLRARNFEESFSNDSAAAIVLQGWLAGAAAEQVMAQNKLTAKQYDAARKRVWRKAAIWAAKQSR